MVEQGPGADGASVSRMLRDIALYTLARLVMVAVLTVAILLVARLIGVGEMPLVVALLFGIVISLPLGVWLLAPLRRRASTGIAEVDERRRREREQLRARLRGEDPPGQSAGR